MPIQGAIGIPTAIGPARVMPPPGITPIGIPIAITPVRIIPPPGIMPIGI